MSKIIWRDPEDAEFFGDGNMMLNDKYLYSSLAVQEERQIKWEVTLEESNTAKRIVEFQKTGKVGGHFSASEWKEEKAKAAKEIPADWIETQRNRDKEKELLVNLAARNTWGLVE